MKVGIYNLTDGRYQVSHLNAEGKRLRHKFNNYRDAKTYANQVGRIKPRLNTDCSKSIAELLQEYFVRNPDSPIKKRSLELFESFVKYFGHLHCSDLNKPICNHWIESLKTERNYSSRTLRLCKYLYSVFFKDLVEQGLIETNYMAAVYVKLGTRSRNRNFLSEAELIQILDGLKKFSLNVSYPVIYFLIHTGCKVGEALKLKWTDLNLEAGNVLFPVTPNANGREINLSPKLLEFLRQYPKNSEYVFTNEKNEPWSVNGFYKRMSSDRTAIDFKRDWDSFTFRHTFAYHFLRCGKTLQQLQVVIGHRNIQQTIDFYGDIVSESEQKSSPY